MERLTELLNAESGIKQSENPPAFSPTGQGKTTLQDISFYYPSRPEHLALNSFSLEINPGETVTLVGPSGAENSTVLQLTFCDFMIQLLKSYYLMELIFQ